MLEVIQFRSLGFSFNFRKTTKDNVSLACPGNLIIVDALCM